MSYESKVRRLENKHAKTYAFDKTSSISRVAFQKDLCNNHRFSSLLLSLFWFIIRVGLINNKGLHLLLIHICRMDNFGKLWNRFMKTTIFCKVREVILLCAAPPWLIIICSKMVPFYLIHNCGVTAAGNVPPLWERYNRINPNQRSECCPTTTTTTTAEYPSIANGSPIRSSLLPGWRCANHNVII